MRTLLRFVLLFCAPLLGAGEVTLVRVPDDGIQPQASVDETGVLHLIYYKGEAGGGDIFYVKSSDFGKTFSKPLRVNSGENAAIAMGNIRGARLAVGKSGRVHVAWMGSGAAQPRGPAKESPMLYTHSNAAGDGFEPQRNLITAHYGLDGGGAVAADSKGKVWVFWGGMGSVPGEADRSVYVARSDDGGATFAPETLAEKDKTGMCACCGLSALAAQGHVYVLYRAATEKTRRGMQLLAAADGSAFSREALDDWTLNSCPMSASALVSAPKGVLRAWEKSGQVYYSQAAEGKPIPAPGNGTNRKYPVLAASAAGDILLAWTEGMGWDKGGRLSYAVYDKDGKAGPALARDKMPQVPKWSLIAAVAKPDNGFVILY